MFSLIKQACVISLRFGGSLASLVKVSKHTKYISLNSQQCLIKPNFINLHSNVYDQELLTLLSICS